MMQVIDYLITSAHAETTAATPAASTGGGISFFVMFLIFFVFIYFGIWRPQNKRAREQQSLFNSLAKGDEVVTAGGILGRIIKINEQYITLAVGNQSEMILQKSSVVSLLPKGTLKTLE